VPMLLEAAAPELPFPHDVRWSQLEPGHLAVSRRAFEGVGITFARHDFNLGIKATTDSPRLKNAVCVTADERTSARWFGAHLGFGHIAVSRGAVDLSTAGPASLYSMTIDPYRLLRAFPTVSEARGLVHVDGDARLEDDIAIAMALRRYVQCILEVCESPAKQALAPALEADIGGTLLPMLALLFEDRRASERSRSDGRRIAAVRRCEQYVRSNVEGNPTLYDLSRISGLRLRSLINAFQAVTGMSPMAYLKRQRLNGVHQSLLVSDQSQTRIIDVAANWGFWHMGHFTADYRKMFGETPSETLRNR
jgi:AraC family transcriptional regulator, ethanolamine operon transcriptional activator